MEKVKPQPLASCRRRADDIFSNLDRSGEDDEVKQSALRYVEGLCRGSIAYQQRSLRRGQ